MATPSIGIGKSFSYFDNTKGEKSAYHERCVPAQSKTQASSNGPSKNFGEADFRKCDAVTQDTIWKQSVDKERGRVKQWEDNWGFLTEFDEKGNPKPPKEMPDDVTVFGGEVPVTNAGNYGSRSKTELGMHMQKLEFNFYAQRRRKKLGDEMICY